MNSDLMESRVESTCQECGGLYYHWRSAARRYCSKFCAYKHTYKTHGLTGTTEHRTWKAMRWRCNEKSPDRERYFDRGITVCPRWDNFLNFLDDMGKRPTPKHTLDRLDNDLGYSPTNCRWATMKQQANNTSRTNFVIAGGNRINLTEIHEKTGVHLETLRARVKKGWSYNKIIDTPIKAAFRGRNSDGRFI